MIYDLIETLIDYAIKKELIDKEDVVYFKNRILDYLNLSSLKEGKVLDLSLEEIVDKFDDYAVENNFINDTVTERDIYDTELISILVDRPSNVTKKFKELYLNNAKDATDFFYKYSIDTNYIRKYRVDRDLKWTKASDKYGSVVITINLSKPEKDPKDIERQKNMPKSNYPICLLCKENEGYKGRLDHPARGNIRLIPLKLEGEDFFMQYSPYSYYNEHCIVLSSEHKPMVINEKTIAKLLDFVEYLPHYFIGSNADLPIVGGSILAHEHFQGGNFRFPMTDAKGIYDFKLAKYSDINAKIIKWPLSVIRLESKNKKSLVSAFKDIMDKWINYTDEDAFIYAYTDGVRHNTITPIARINDDGLFELDLVLRNNITTEEHPLGVFHPHQEYHHIKKENIGLIEVMGLAVLPSRLKLELEELGHYLVDGLDVRENETLLKHALWADELKKKYTFTKDNYMKILQDEIADMFLNLLEDCGVFKQTEEGLKHFKKFIEELNK